MTPAGRPLRFLGFVLGGWVAMRVIAWSVPQGDAPVVSLPMAQRSGASATTPVRPMVMAVLPSKGWRGLQQRPLPDQKTTGPSQTQWVPSAAATGADNDDAERNLMPLETPRAQDPLAVSVAPWPGPTDASGARRWSFSAWALWRPDAGGSRISAPLLGGSQAGLRLDYRLSSRISLYSRVSRAFSRPFAEEAALGIAVRPIAALPVSLMAERRQKLGEGGRSDFALIAAGGIGPAPLGARGELDGYVQAGLVGLREGDGFADGRISVSYRLTGDDRRADLAVGLSTWASVQPGAQRVDVGPEVRLRLPIGGGRFRLSAEWRERIAGDARPASGPAVTLVSEF